MPRLIKIGERFPDFVLPVSGQPTQLYSRIGGRPAVVVLCRDHSEVEGILGAISGDADIVVVSTQTVDRELSFTDAEQIILGDHLGETPQVIYVLDANLRVVCRDETGRVESVNAVVLSLLHEVSRSIQSQAPVLMIDRVLEPDRCAFLMNLWERAGSVETGVEQSTSHGRDDVLSAGHKARRDHTVEDPKLIQLLTQSVGRRILTEIERAFIYRPTRFEGFKIACYDAASSGFFSAHRDNLSPTTAHRRLAVSLNLNDGYSGGALRFPEFGSDTYSPRAGSALVFSCAHLHEVLPVTEERRFTLLTFLYDDSVKREAAVDPFGV